MKQQRPESRVLDGPLALWAHSRGALRKPASCEKNETRVVAHTFSFNLCTPEAKTSLEFESSSLYTTSSRPARATLQALVSN